MTRRSGIGAAALAAALAWAVAGGAPTASLAQELARDDAPVSLPSDTPDSMRRWVQGLEDPAVREGAAQRIEVRQFGASHVSNDKTLVRRIHDNKRTASQCLEHRRAHGI